MDWINEAIKEGRLTKVIATLNGDLYYRAGSKTIVELYLLYWPADTSNMSIEAI